MSKSLPHGKQSILTYAVLSDVDKHVGVGISSVRCFSIVSSEVGGDGVSLTSTGNNVVVELAPL